MDRRPTRISRIENLLYPPRRPFSEALLQRLPQLFRHPARFVAQQPNQALEAVEDPTRVEHAVGIDEFVTEFVSRIVAVGRMTPRDEVSAKRSIAIDRPNVVKARRTAA